MSPFMGDAEFKEEWFGEDEEGNSLHEIGMRGGWDADQARRGARQRRRHRRGHVPRPRRRHRHDGRAVRRGLQPVATMDPEHLLAGARAYNRWAAEMCQESPERRAGLIVAPILGDLDGAIAEIQRAHADGLTGGIIIPPQWGDHASYTSYRYDPVWAVCEELDLPVHCHSGPGAHKDYGEVPGWMSVYGYETIFFTSRPLWFMLLTGVFERFPRLQHGGHRGRAASGRPTCCGALDMMAIRDHGCARWPTPRGIMKMLPSEYFDRNCGIGSSNTRRRELARRYEIGVGNIMWGNDFPHPEGTWPYTREFLKDRFWDIPEDETAQILGLNAAEFYNFDLDKLAPIADRIGPTPEELGQTDDVGRRQVGRPQGGGPAVAHRRRGRPARGRLTRQWHATNNHWPVRPR